MIQCSAEFSGTRNGTLCGGNERTTETKCSPVLHTLACSDVHD